MLSLPDSPPQLPGAGAWGSLYDVQEPVKPHQVVLVPAAATFKKTTYGGRKKNLETCTEALGCETGAVDAIPAGNVADGGDACVEAECAERKRPAREEEEEAMEGRARRSGRRPLPPPLTTLARGASRVRMVHERRDGRLEVYAVRTPGVVEAERSGGRLRMRLLPLPCDAVNAAAARRRQEPQEPEAEKEKAKEAEEEEAQYGVAMYVRGGRCVEREGGAAAARRGKQWEPEQAAAFWVATS
ncbi:protein FANTASTIC FOUR 2-like [Phragmites australis]|uniref:protein FANTASTIC FOUR 2-like n=1 Tax=Phragmites australis TaxID=29695 RepID=UPI002D765699|nr:protein FANTASTIC FOUR 2-like [Phragmites australis]